jgi:glycosyltransferase involved in cell wall biosynthesis
LDSQDFFVTAIIPVYNGEAFLADAISSILRQHHEPLEVIVVDDGSTDNSAAIAKSFPSVSYVYQANRGAPSARNQGLKMAQGDMIGFLDADDLWSDDKVKLQLSCFRRKPSAEIVVGYTQRMQKINLAEGRHEFRNFSDPVLGMDFVASLIRKSVFNKVGPIDETFRQCDDWDWFMRAKELGVNMLVHKEVSRFYRRHDGNITNQTEKANHYQMMMLKRSLDRRRRGGDGKTQLLPKLSDSEED